VLSREVSLAGKVLTVDNEFTARRRCTLAPLDHFDPYAPAGSRVLLPWGQIVCIVDRDGVTPEHMNPFREIRAETIEGMNKERCFFVLVRPLADGTIPLCLLYPHEDKCGLGVRYSRAGWNKSFWIVVWYSPSTNRPEWAAFGLEGGVLPLGGTRTAQLNLRPELCRGERLGWKCEIHFLEDEDEIDLFLSANALDRNSTGPEEIYPDWAGQFASVEDYDPKVAEFRTLLAAGLVC
jgi:hypothetical protein